MRNFIRYWNQNKKKIIIIVAIIAFTFIIIRIINNFYKNKPINVSSSNIDRTKPIQSVITGEKVSEEKTEENINVIKEFVNYCNNKEYEKAYELLTEDCKSEFDNNINVFIQNYCSKIFKTKKTYNIDLWLNENNSYTYRVKLYEGNMLETGKSDLSQNVADYITVNKTNGENKISIYGFIQKCNIDKSQELNGIEIKINNKKVYKNYETYNITIKNKTSSTILIGKKLENKDIYLIDKNGMQYYSFLSEMSLESLFIKSGEEKNINIRFDKIYDLSRTVTSIKFNNIILDGEKYLENEKNNDLNKQELTINI